MRVIVLDASAEERHLLANVVQQSFSSAEVYDGSGHADIDRFLAAMQPIPNATRTSGLGRDIQAAALFPLENPNPVLRIGRDGTVLFANRAGERLLQAGGLSGSDPLPDRWRQLVQEILANGQVRRLRLALEDEVFELDGVPILEADYLNVYGRNVTAQVRYAEAERRAAEALQRANEELEQRVQERTAELVLANESLAQQEAAVRYLANLLEYIHEAVIAYDLDYRVTAWNHAAEELFGWPASVVLGRPLAEFLPTTLLKMAREDVYRQIAEHGSWHGELNVTRRDGSRIDMEATCAAVRDASGQLVGLVAVNRDITERKRIEEELRVRREQLEDLMRRMVELQERERYDVANQLYNDEGQRLAALLLNLSRLQRDTRYSPAMTAQLTEMIALADGVLQDMHSLAVTLRPASLDRLGLGPALQQCACALGAEFAVAIQTELSVFDGLRLPRDAESSLYRIVQQGLRNAVQHAQARCISVTAANTDGRLKIVVEDDGAGFDVAEAQRQGGLGLLDMRERARALGGSLTVESAPGKGTTLYIEVPAG